MGDGEVGGVQQDIDLSVGDTVVYSKFGIGAYDVRLGGEDYTLIKEDDIIGTMPRQGATAADVPELKPGGDRVLLKVGTCADWSRCRCPSGTSPLLIPKFQLDAIAYVFAEVNSLLPNVNCDALSGLTCSGVVAQCAYLTDYDEHLIVHTIK